MEGSISRGGLLGGIGMFLVGMMMFEDTIKQVGKGWLKRVLQRYTDTLAKSVGVGMIQTFIFQSSSIVTMITLGFVGAWIIGMYNWLGVVLWANIGTTLTPWLVYLLGFQIPIEQYMLPLIGVWGITLMMTGPQTVRHSAAKFVIWFALLFLGLDYMKVSVEALATTIDLSAYAHRWVIWFAVIWAIITTVMQTSTWVTIIALTALSSWLISFDMALGIVIGANVWSALSTSVMWFLSSNRAQATKKQISISHLIFNGSTALLILTLIEPLKHLIIMIVGDSDPALMLTIFHTVFNVVLIAIWLPLLKRYTRQITERYVDHQHTHQYAISQINTTVSEEIICALRYDIAYLIDSVIQYNRTILWVQWPDSRTSILEMYAQLKQWESTLLSAMANYHHDETKDTTVFQTIDLYDDLLLDILASSKYLKDMVEHYDNIADADWYHGREFYASLRDTVMSTMDKIDEILHHDYDAMIYDDLNQSMLNNLNQHHEIYSTMVSRYTDHSTPATFVSELIKTQHYTMLSCQRLIDATYRYKVSLVDGDCYGNCAILIPGK